MLRRIFVIWILSSSVLAEVSPSDDPEKNFCVYPEKVINNENLAKEHPKDEVLIKLVAMRIGLCDLLAKGVIELEFAVDLFESERVKQMFKRREDELSKQRAKML